MRKLKVLWKRLSFAKQLMTVFIGIFLLQMLAVQLVNTYYLSTAIERQMAGSFGQTVKQTGQNINSTLTSYHDLINQMVIDSNFVRCVKMLDDESEEKVRAAKEYLEDKMKDFMTYQAEVRCISIQTEEGTLFAYDKMQNDLLNQPIPAIHREFYEEDMQKNVKAIQGKWLETKFLDRQGTKEYYVCSFGKNIYDWHVNRYVGTIIVSVEEDILARICEDARISEDYDMNSVCVVNEDNILISCHDKELLGKNAREVFGLTAEETDWNGDKDNIIFQEPIGTMGWKLVSVLHKDYILRYIKEAQQMIFTISLLLGLLTVIGVAWVSSRMTKYVKDVVNVMNQVEDGELSAQVGIKTGEKNEIALIAQQFNRMMEKVNEQMEMTRQAGIREKEAEIRALEAQINPHFIYNTLDSVNWIAIENKQEKISRMLSQFARILRYQIQQSNQIVTIREELEYLEMYLYLQKIRFMESFAYVIECQEEVKDARIHKMIFQPFVENAVIHGVADLDYPGLIKIRIRICEDRRISFLVSDNGKGMTQEQIEKVFRKRENPGNSIGVLNVLARLDLYYGKDYEIRVESGGQKRIQKGTQIEVVFTNENHYS